MRHGVPLPSERSSTSPYTLCIGGMALVFNVEVKIEVDFFSLASASGNFPPEITQKLYPKKRRGHPATGRPLL
jgi:hypothetical protein